MVQWPCRVWLIYSTVVLGNCCYCHGIGVLNPASGSTNIQYTNTVALPGFLELRSVVMRCNGMVRTWNRQYLRPVVAELTSIFSIVDACQIYYETC